MVYCQFATKNCFEKHCHVQEGDEYERTLHDLQPEHSHDQRVQQRLQQLLRCGIFRGSMSFSFTSVHCPQVYSPPISTKYSEVYWTMMDPVALDKDLVARFQGKTMAIVGYETDQVIVTEGQPDVSVPITHAYNHHFEVPRCYLVVNLVGLSFRLTLRDEEGGGRGGCGSYGQGHEQPWRACLLPHIQVGSCKAPSPLIILCPTQT